MSEVIEPGKGVGKIRLGMTFAEVARLLGKPKEAHALKRAGKKSTSYAWRSWTAPTKSEAEEPEWSLGIVGDKTERVVQVHVRGKRYTTAEGYSSRTPFATLRRRYSKLEVQEGAIIDDPSGTGYVLYVFSERALGISFLSGTQDDLATLEELKRGTLAPETIVVHAPGKVVLPVDLGELSAPTTTTKTARQLQQLLRSK